MTIGELARAANVATSTVRFYERRGLLRPDARTESNDRFAAASAGADDAAMREWDAGPNRGDA